MVSGHFRIFLYEQRGKVTPPMPGWRREPVFVSFPLASDQNAGLIMSPFQGTSDTRICILNKGRLLAM